MTVKRGLCNLRLMNRKVIPLTIFSLAVVAIGFLATRLYRPVGGSGRLVNEQRQIAPFNRLTVDNIGYLHIEQSDEQIFLVEAEDNILPHVVAEVKEKNLQISLGLEHALRLIRPTKPVRVFVTVRDLRQLTVNGRSEIESANAIKTDFIEINLNGESKLTAHIEAQEVRINLGNLAEGNLKGWAGIQTVRMNGASQYSAKDFDVRESYVSIDGQGKALIKAAEKLTVQINGDGEIEYLGNPVVEEKISGSGRVRRL